MLLGARQLFWLNTKKALPYDAEVEYLESTGTQWIDSGIDAAVCNSEEMTIKTVFAVTGTGGSGGTYNGIFGAAVPRFGVYTRNYNLCWGYGVAHDNVKAFTFGDWINSTCTFTKGSQTANFDGTAFSATNASNLSSRNIGIFCRNASPSPQWLAKARIKRLVIETSSTLRDFIPVRKGTVGYLYDRVSGKLFGNSGTGDFVLGRDINPISARSYVQDGLVAMWDGIENAGWGVHDPNATAWTDLTGNHVLDYEFEPTFTSDAFVLPGNNKVAYCESPKWRDAVSANQCTVELCLKGCNFGSNNSPLSLNTSRTATTNRPWWLWGKIAMSFRTTFASWTNQSLLNQTEEVSLSFPLADCYKNGSLVQTGQPGTTTASGSYLMIGKIGPYSSTIGQWPSLRADIHSIRIYSRVLTADEIAHNYEIDKERFSLP